MATTRDEIRGWLMEAKKKEATHMIVVADTFSWEDYPVYVLPGDSVTHQIVEYSKNMQKVMEVYKMSEDLEEQLAERRAYRI